MPPVQELSVTMNDVNMNEGCCTTQGLLAPVMGWMHTCGC